jgi:hypothetical protein
MRPIRVVPHDDFEIQFRDEEVVTVVKGVTVQVDVDDLGESSDFVCTVGYREDTGGLVIVTHAPYSSPAFIRSSRDWNCNPEQGQIVWEAGEDRPKGLMDGLEAFYMISEKGEGD